MIPKGKLLIIGGAEARGAPPFSNEKVKEYTRYEILSELVPESKRQRVEIVTTGSGVQQEVKNAYQKVFYEIGYKNIGFIPIKERREAGEKKYISRAEKAGTIFLRAVINFVYPPF